MNILISTEKKKSFVDRAFRISLVIKGIDGILELIGGALLLFVKPAAIGRTIGFLTRHELAQDPNDFFANFFLHTAHQLSVSTEFLASIYLLAHGIIKVALVIGILTGRRKLYPYALFFLGLFVLIEFGRIIEVFSVGIFVLMLFDLFVITMVWLEFQRARTPSHLSNSL